MEIPNSAAYDFVRYCIQRNGKEWPALYDEMCWVAGHRLFRGMGYAELRRLGICLNLSNLQDMLRMVNMVTAEKP